MVSAENGSTVQLTATVEPDNADDKRVVWSSTDESVATVSSTGLVTIVSNGTAAIRATAIDGRGVFGICTVSGFSGIDNISDNLIDELIDQDIYNIVGQLIKRSATYDDIKSLEPGIYIIGNRKFIIR